MFLSFLEVLGVFVFAISGLLNACEKKLDYFGGIVIAFFTALGGGTLRDLLLNTEIAWMHSLQFIYAALAGAVIGILFKNKLNAFRRTFFTFDTIGLGLYMILGIKKGMLFDHFAISCLFLGVITATFGGVIRDILLNQIPLIFRKEIYATAGIVGGLCFLGLDKAGYNNDITMLLCILIIIGIRLASVFFGWKMPLLTVKK